MVATQRDAAAVAEQAMPRGPHVGSGFDDLDATVWVVQRAGWRCALAASEPQFGQHCDQRRAQWALPMDAEWEPKLCSRLVIIPNIVSGALWHE